MDTGKNILAKVIARRGYCSRRDALQLILDGSVKLNGVVVTDPKVMVTDQSIKINDKLLPKEDYTKVWLFHKPRNYIVTTNDPKNRKTIFSILPKSMPRVISVGRLDMDTEGLMLLTNNGELARYMELPSTGWTRSYRVKVHGSLERLKNNITRIASHGIIINNTKYSPAKIIIEQEGNTNNWLRVSIVEGKNREVRNIMEYFGLKVIRLIRMSFGPFHLSKTLPVGSVKLLSKKNIKEAIGNKIRLEY